MSGTYPVGTLTVRGTDIEIFTNDAGEWLAYPGNAKVTAGTRDGLKAALGRQLRSAAVKVAVPFLVLESPPTPSATVRVRRGTATGIHSGNRGIMVTWEDGTKAQLGGFGSDKTLDGETDAAEWLRLVEARNAASRAVYDFEQARKIDLRAAVRAALDAAVAGQEAAEDGGPS